MKYISTCVSPAFYTLSENNKTQRKCPPPNFLRQYATAPLYIRHRLPKSYLFNILLDNNTELALLLSCQYFQV